MPGMGDERKRAGAGFWAMMALLAVLLAYPLSGGPVTYLVTRHRIPSRSREMRVLEVFYAPHAWFYINGPEAYRKVYERYLDFWRAIP
jgi:hypothetical protein